MRRADLLMIPLLLVLGLAASVERRVHHVLFLARHGDPDTLLRAPVAGVAARPNPTVEAVRAWSGGPSGTPGRRPGGPVARRTSPGRRPASAGHGRARAGRSGGGSRAR